MSFQNYYQPLSVLVAEYCPKTYPRKKLTLGVIFVGDKTKQIKLAPISYFENVENSPNPIVYKAWEDFWTQRLVCGDSAIDCLKELFSGNTAEYSVSYDRTIWLPKSAEYDSNFISNVLYKELVESRDDRKKAKSLQIGSYQFEVTLGEKECKNYVRTMQSVYEENSKIISTHGLYAWMGWGVSQDLTRFVFQDCPEVFSKEINYLVSIGDVSSQRILHNKRVKFEKLEIDNFDYTHNTPVTFRVIFEVIHP